MSLFQKITEYPAKSIQIFSIDFTKPWWHIFFKQKSKIAVVVFSTITGSIMNTLIPTLVCWALETESYANLFIVFAAWALEEVSSWFLWTPKIIQLYAQTIESFHYNAYEKLLAVDPFYHGQQSSGVGIGKISRTMEAFREMTKNLLDELIPLLVGLIATVVTLAVFDMKLGLGVGALLVVVACIFAYFVMTTTDLVEKTANADDDRANHYAAESLIQATYIRSTFSTEQVRNKLYTTILQKARSLTILFTTYRWMRGIFIFFYILSLGAVMTYLLFLVRQGQMTQLIALGLLTTLLRSTQPLLKIDRRIRDTLSAKRKIADFYHFITRFGKRTFPVFHFQLPEPVEIVQPHDVIALSVDTVTVGYPHHRPLFTEISLQLSVPVKDRHKLFGIIGPSGIGKTTLVSLLGGQMKPPAGLVTINGYDIYALSDHERQKLIALQSQTASGFHGTLAHNLTFGLPVYHNYTSDNLIDLLQAVGLWDLFKNKQGLQTLVGESGTTLSGGQRQRLNFANLFLRAQTYKPAVILIDEPTSSLDEISEQKITEMINLLAQDSVTLVIAHRIKTLENAQKIMDISLLSESSSLEFYSQAELLKKSYFYQQLMTGKAGFGE